MIRKIKKSLKSTLPYLPRPLASFILRAYLIYLNKSRPKIKQERFSLSSPPYFGEIKNLISIVLPVYNQADLLSQSIDSVLSQSYQNFELIIVNDGSTDGVEKVLQKYTNHPKIIIINQKNLGLPQALSNGFSLARGEYYTWTSADNIMGKDALVLHKNYLASHLTIGMVYSNYLIIDQNGHFCQNTDFLPHRQSPLGSSLINLPKNADRLENHENFIGPSFLYRAYIGKIVGPYSGSLGVEDYDYWLKIHSFFEIARLPQKKPTYLYRIHKNTLTARKGELKLADKMSDLLKENKKRIAYFKLPINFIIYSKNKDYSSNLDNPKSVNLFIFENDFDQNIASFVKKNRHKNIPLIFYLKSNLPTSLLFQIGAQKPDLIITDSPQNFIYLKDKIENLFQVPEPEIKKFLPPAINYLLWNKKNGTNPPQITKNQLSRPKNILFCADSLDKGGLEQALLDIAQNFDKTRYSVKILAQKGGVLEKKYRKNLDIKIIKNISEKDYLKFIKDKKVNIVFSFFAFFIQNPQNPDIKTVEVVQNTYAWFDGFKQKQFQNKDKFINNYIAVSKKAADHLVENLRLDPDKISIIENPIEPLRFKNIKKLSRSSFGFKNDDFIFINPSSFYPPKNHFALLATAKILQKSDPDIKFLLIGNILDQKYFNKLKSAIKSARLTDTIKILPHTEDIASYYALVDALILPSQIEGWSLATNEALFFGLPLLLSDAGGAEQIIEENKNIGIVIKSPRFDIKNLNLPNLLLFGYDQNPPYKKEFASAAQEIKKNKKNYAKNAHNMKKIAQKYSAKNIAQKYQTFIEKNL